VRITQKGIAKALGISLITVSRALNGSGYVSGAMRKRILGYAAKVGYVPHRASQVLVRNKTRRLALFSSSLPPYFWEEIRRGVEAAASYLRGFDFDVQYHCVPDADTQAYLRKLRSELRKGLDAVAFVNQSIYDMASIYAVAERAGVPYVLFNVAAPGSRGLCYIGSDYVAGGRLAADVVGTTLRFCRDPSVLVVAAGPAAVGGGAGRVDGAPFVDLNYDRLSGFLEVMRDRFPAVNCDVRRVDAPLEAGAGSDEMLELLRDRRGKVEAVYLIPAINPTFLDALEATGYSDTINVVHDLDLSARRYLDAHLLTAVIHQNPYLQGFYAVKTMEHIVEYSVREPLPTVEIASDAIFAENRAVTARHLEFIE